MGARVRTRSGFRFRIQFQAGVKEKSGIRGQNHMEPRSRGQSKHRTQHPHLRVQPMPLHLPLGSASWPSLGSSSPSLPLGCLRSHLCVHPPGQAARIPRSICLRSCRGNQARRMGPSLSPSEPASRLLAFTALPRSLRAGLALPSPNAVHCSVPANRQALPRWAGTEPCLPASCLRHCSLPAWGPEEVPTPWARSPGHHAGLGKGRARRIT